MQPLSVVVGITGGIAAYKAVSVVRGFVVAGHDVHVVATDAALRFVGRPTLEAISRNIVHSELYEGVSEVRHVAIGHAADLIVIAPATANTIAKLAAGLADDLLGNTVLASTAPVVIAPAMHTEMWQNPATQANVAILRGRGMTIVGPETGALTGKDSGPGRMAEPDTIVHDALERVSGRPGPADSPAATAAPSSATGAPSDGNAGSATRGHGDLSGTHVLISLGGTREPLDPVRFLGNRSSGRQGIALAQACLARGARVTLVAAHLEVPVPDGCDVVDVSTAAELRTEMLTRSADADTIVMAAAVADFRPAHPLDQKIKKNASSAPRILELVENPDVLTELAQRARPDQVVVGFAAETEPDDDALLDVARRKLRAKGCDLLIVNRVGWSETFGGTHNTVTVLARGGDVALRSSGDKLSVAGDIMDHIARRGRV